MKKSDGLVTFTIDSVCFGFVPILPLDKIYKEVNENCCDIM